MLKYLRMDLYRLFKGKMLWVMLVVLLVMAAIMAAMMWWSSTPEFAAYVNEQAVQGQSVSSSGFSVGITDGSNSAPERLNGIELEDFEQNQSSIWLTAGAMGSIVPIVIALFFALDFSSGYVKNLPASRRGRMEYYSEKLVLIVLLTAVLFAFAVISFELFRTVAGLTYGHVGTVAEVAVWFALAVVLISAYGAITALVTWLSRGKAAGIAAAIVLGAGILEGLLVMAFSSLASVWEPFGSVSEWLPFSSYQLIARGGEALLASPGDIGHVLVSSVVIIAACAAVALGVCSRRDV